MDLDHAHRRTPAESRDVVAGHLVGFLSDRLTDELAALWERDASRVDHERRPGLAAQVAVLDDVLSTLRQDRLPERSELRILLFGYAAHPDFDPLWNDLLNP